MRKTIRIVTALTALALSAAGLGARSHAAAAAPRTHPAIAAARVWIEDMHGHVVHRVRAKTMVQFVVTFTLPRSFPAGYTDVRFNLAGKKGVERTIIYGSPRHLRPGQSLRISVAQSAGREVGVLKVTGLVTLLRRPGGIDLPYMGRGVAYLRVTR